MAGVLVAIPRKLPRHPPLLVAFHGYTDVPSFLAGETGFGDIAGDQGFVVAYPAAASGRRWQLGSAAGNADLVRTRAAITALTTRICADPRRVYLTGFSNGAGFAYLAGCALAALVAAVAPVSGSYSGIPACPAGTRAMPTLEIHGVDPWTSSVTRLIAAMTQRNGCTRAPATTRIARGVTRTRWPGCNLERIYNRNIGHEWPRAAPYNTGLEIWRFVSRFRR